MKYFIIICILQFFSLFCLFSQTPGEIITLDLSKPSYPSEIKYTDKGCWEDTYSNNYPQLDFGLFSFSHLVRANGNQSTSKEISYWDGFTICNSGDTQDYGSMGSSDGWITNQWGCMAGGGIKTDENGDILIDNEGKVIAEKGIPYLLGYWGYYFKEGEETIETLVVNFKDGNAYETQSIYINNHPWPYYGNIHGDGFGSAFEEGDFFKLLIHGLDENLLDNGKIVEYTLAEYKNGELIQSVDWEKVDLTSLGTVYGIYFTMETSDFDPLYGPNTAVYFCMDKLQVKVPEPIAVKGIQLDQTEVIIKQNETLRLKAIFTPENAANKAVVWASSSPDIAKVSSSGQITALKPGKTIITVTSIDGGYKANCLVEVISNPVTDIKISDKRLELFVGQKYTLTSKVYPENASNRDVEWISSNPAIVEVNQSGEIDCRAEGNAVITVKSVDSGIKAYCSVAVLRINKPVTRISFDVDYKELTIKESFRLTAIIEPEDADNKRIAWASENENIATIDWNGKVIAINTGETVITATALDGNYTAECRIKVKEYTNIHEISTEELNIYPNPAYETLFINNEKEKINEIVIMNMQGNIFYHMGNPTDVTIKVGVGSWPKGIYIVRLTTTDNQTIHRKVIKY